MLKGAKLMLHILIVDDEAFARQELAYLVNLHPQVSRIDQAESVTEALTIMLDNKPDIVFLDIQLDGETGFDLAYKFLQMRKPPYLIFATAYENYALDAFKVNANDYILKPFEENKIQAALNKYLQYSELSASDSTDTTSKESSSNYDTIAIQSDDRVYLLHPEDIFLVSVQGHTVTVDTLNKSFVTTGTLSAIEKKLPDDLFLRCHRSFILNITHIVEIQPWFNQTYQVTLSNHIKVPVSRSYLKSFKTRLNIN